MALYCGIDLHSNHHVVMVIDEEDRRILGQRAGNDVTLSLNALEPYRSDLAGVAVESTFNWFVRTSSPRMADPKELDAVC